MSEAVTIAAALGAGVVAGVWFAFSGFVMAALDRLPAARAAEAMQAINVTAVRPPLMIAMFGTALLCLAAAIGGDPLAIAAAAVYWLGCVGVTIGGNVPLNDALERDASVWPAYRARWTAWNSARGAATLVTAGLLMAAVAATGLKAVPRRASPRRSARSQRRRPARPRWRRCPATASPRRAGRRWTRARRGRSPRARPAAAGSRTAPRG